MTTKVLLAERIQIFLGGGVRPDGQKVHLYELERAVEDVTNKLLKMEYMSGGESIPNGAATATYDEIPVVKYKNSSSSILPGMPVRLPLNAGVRIFNSSDVAGEFIPLQKGDLSYLQTQPLINNLLGYIGFEVDGTRVIYSQDISISNPTVTMKLVVLDITQYGDNDLLPITSDQEWDIFGQIVKLYGMEPPADKLAQPTIAPPPQPVQA